MDSTLPQPPANREPTPPALEKTPSSRKERLLSLMGASVMLFILFAVFGPMFFSIPRNRLAANRTEAINNLRSVGCSLMEFDSEYGSFPNAATAVEVKSNTGTALTLGDGSANQLFRQLMAVGLKSEKPFWAKTANSPKKPDDIYRTDATALAPGEVGFAYISGLSTTTHPKCPLAVTPLLPGKRAFDTKPFTGKAIVLFTDNSTVVLEIDKQGRASLNGMDLFDPRQPFWGGKTADIKWPE
jgi:hypothetical protein